ncbi:MAG: hypothetical protein IKB88_01565 [Clostridia bacterium]|nr:hypothetical protein [Clostridia bacterium]
MGTSILLIFIIPAMIFEVIFSFVSGAFVGYPTAKVELPYNEATGLVWEYDNVDDPYINLADTEIEDGKQIFYFECSGMNFEPNGEMMELVFTDRNGNEEVFYCVTSAKINAPSIYSEEECTLTEITLTAQNSVEGGKWMVVENGYYILYHNSSESESETFTVVITPDNKRGDYAEYGRFSVRFAYTNSLDVPEELALATYKYADGEHYLYEIKYDIASEYVENWFDAVFEYAGLK